MTTEEITLSQLVQNNYNPRKHFDDAQMKELEKSIRNQGIVQAITVRPLEGGKYEVVAGTRRFIAAKNAGLKKIPAMVLELSDEQAILLSITENLERADLTPIEEARSFQVYLGWDEKHHFEDGQQKGFRRLVDGLSAQLPMSSDTIYNRLSLLHLSESLQTKVEQETLGIKVANAISRLKGLWKIKTAGMSEEEIDENRDPIKTEIHKVMEQMDDANDEAEASQRVKDYLRTAKEIVDTKVDLASKNKDELEKAEEKLLAQLQPVSFPENIKEGTIEEQIDWYKLHIESNIKELSDERLQVISNKRANAAAQRDRYMMNQEYVKKLVLDTCPHCGAGINIPNIQKRVEELTDEIKALNEDEGETGEELKEWRDKKKAFNRIVRDYNSKLKVYQQSLRT